MPADTARPLLSAATPADDSGAVPTDAAIELAFTEAMKAGSGKIFVTNGATQTYLGRDGLLHTRIVNATDTRAIDIADTSQVTIAGNKVIVKPAAGLLEATAYSVVMEPGVLADLAGNAYAGLADGNRLNFTTAATVPADTVKPAVMALALDDTHLETGEFAVVTLTMSEAVTGIAAADFTVDGGTIDGAPVTEDGITWTVRLVPAQGREGSGTVTFHPANAADAAGNHAVDVPASVEFTYATPAGLSFSLRHDSGLDANDFITDTGSGQGLDIDCALVLNEGDKVQLSIDGSTFTDAQRGEGPGYWYAEGLQLPGDAGTIVVRVVDALGTVRTSLSQQYVVDNVAPAPSAQDAAIALEAASDAGAAGDGITNVDQPWVVVTLGSTAGYRPGDVIEVQEDGFEGPPAGRAVLRAADFDAAGNLLAREVRVQLTGDMLHGVEGTHVFFVRLTDLAGNRVAGDYSEQMLELTIDTTAPTVAIDYASFDFIAGGTTTITGRLMGEPDAGDVVDYTVDGGATWQRAGLDGLVYLHDVDIGYGGTVGLRVADDAGNPGENFMGASTVYVADGYGGSLDVADGTALFAQGGDDRIAIGSLDFAYIDGGSGEDTLDISRLAGPELDMNDLAGRVANIEAIDLGAGTATAMQLTFSTDAALAIAAEGRLRIDGDASDTVILADGLWQWEGRDDTHTTWYNGEVAISIGNDIVLIGDFLEA